MSRVTGEYIETGIESLLYDGLIQPLQGTEDQLRREFKIPILVTNSSGSDYLLRVYSRDSSGNEAMASNIITVNVPGRNESSLPTDPPIFPAALFWSLIALGIFSLIVLAVIIAICCHRKYQSNQERAQGADWVQYGSNSNRKNKSTAPPTTTKTTTTSTSSVNNKKSLQEDYDSIQWSEAGSYSIPPSDGTNEYLKPLN